MKYTMPWNIDHLVHDYKYTSSGHFFDRDTMRFFKSRLTSHYKRVSDCKAYFVTTEKRCFEDNTRVASVRSVTLKPEKNGYGRKYSIETVEGLHGVTLYMAKKYVNTVKE